MDDKQNRAKIKYQSALEVIDDHIHHQEAIHDIQNYVYDLEAKVRAAEMYAESHARAKR